MSARLSIKVIIGLVVIGVLVMPTQVFALIFFHPTYRDFDAWNKDWPANVKELAKSEGRVPGYWINGNDFLFFCGGTNAFNEFLKQYATLKNTPLTVILHPDSGITNTTIDNEWIDFDWQLNILRRGRHSRAPKDPTMDKAYVVGIELWLGGDAELLDKIKVPLNVDVKSGGEVKQLIAKEIQQFIAEHETRQKRLKEVE